MKNKYLIVFFTLALALTACGQAATAEPVPTVALDTGASDSASVLGNTVIASAEVRPQSSVNLSFSLLGMVKSVEVEVGDIVTASMEIAQLDTAILEARIAEAEASVVIAETQVQYLRRVGVGNAYEQIDSALADVDRAQAMVDQLQAQLAQATLTTPISGTVITVDVAPGETASPGQVIIIVADLDRMRIETTDLSERDIPAVQIGQTASVFIDALDEAFEGKVVDIDRQSETVGGDVTYKVIIDLNQNPSSLRWGMSAEVEIQTE